MISHTLDSKNILLFGCTGSLGRNYASYLVNSGCKVFLVDVSPFPLKELATELKCPYCVADALIPDTISQCIIDAVAEFGTISGAIYNAAITSELLASSAENPFPDFFNYPIDLWQRTIDINLTGAFVFLRDVSDHMRHSPGTSSIVLSSSIYGLLSPDHRLYEGESFDTFPSYSASKSALYGLVRWSATYLAKYNIRVNALSPGGVYNGHSDSFVAKYSNRVPMNRMAQPTDLTGALSFLLSDVSSYFTGQNLIVDGGLSAW